MLLTSPWPPALVIASVGAIVIIFLTAIVGTRLFASAGKADRHLASGMALTSLISPSQVSAPVELTERAARVATATAAQPKDNSSAPRAVPSMQSEPSDDASQLIFAQLNEYYAANISQGNTIFWASLLSMCIGFAIIFAGVLSAGVNGITAIVAAIAGVLSQFIAATFLVVLRSTQQQATAYAQSLVELHLRDVARAAEISAVALGLRLLNEISSDRTNPANATKASIAMGLIVKQSSTIVEPPGVTVEAPLSEPVLERRSRSGTVIFDEPGAAERR